MQERIFAPKETKPQEQAKVADLRGKVPEVESVLDKIEQALKLADSIQPRSTWSYQFRHKKPNGQCQC